MIRLADIKEKNNNKNTIKVLNKTAMYSQKLKSNIVSIKEKASTKNDDTSAEEYGNNKILEGQKKILSKGKNQLNKYGRKTIRETRDNIRKTNKILRNIKQKETEKKAIKTAQKTAKGTIKKTQKAVKSAEKTGKTAIKTSAKTTKVAIQTAKKTYQILKLTAKATVKGVKVGVKVATTTVKAIQSAIKAVVAFLINGGWIPVVIILVICLLVFIFTSVFGVFFSDEKSENIFGISTSIGSNDIVEVANKQVGNKRRRNILELVWL